VTSTKVTILVETAERSDMIDKERAKRARDIAESKVDNLSREDGEREAAKAALIRATVRLSVAEKG
jgi:F-type H+-transporting ATPase subunit epsilon